MAQTPQQASVKESVVVRAAEIEVLVLDSKGRPVTDLRRDEFLLTVDGRPRKIDWILPPPARKGDVVAVQEIPIDLPETLFLSPAPTLPHSTVFFVDDMHLDFRSRYMGLRAIEVHASTLPPEEEVAVYSFRRRLEIVQRFTTDRTAVTASVKRLGKATPVSLQLNGPVDWVGESQASLQGLSQMLTTLSGRPEPKTVIVLGGYLPVHSLGRPDPFRPDASFDFMDQIRQAERDAFLARATVVALDPSGIHPFGPEADQAAPTRLGDFGSSSQPPAADDFRSDIASSSSPAPSSDHLESRGDAFAVLARDTGGSRLSTSNQPEKLLAAETELLNSRYRIGFMPDAVTSQTRSVAVAVTRAGLRVRTATGQRSLSGETMVRSRFASALLSRDLPLADFPIRVDANKPPKGWFSTKALSFEIRLPAQEVFVEDRGETLNGGVEVLVATADDQGGISDIRSQAVEVRISKSDAGRIPHSYFKIPLSLHVAGKGLLLVGVRDTTTNRVGHARVSYGK